MRVAGTWGGLLWLVVPLLFTLVLLLLEFVVFLVSDPTIARVNERNVFV